MQPAVSIRIATGFETVSFLAKKADEYFSEALTHPVLIKKSLNGRSRIICRAVFFKQPPSVTVFNYVYFFRMNSPLVPPRYSPFFRTALPLI